jgi:hypothetical protein
MKFIITYLCSTVEGFKMRMEQTEKYKGKRKEKLYFFNLRFDDH